MEHSKIINKDIKRERKCNEYQKGNENEKGFNIVEFKISHGLIQRSNLNSSTIVSMEASTLYFFRNERDPRMHRIALRKRENLVSFLYRLLCQSMNYLFFCLAWWQFFSLLQLLLALLLLSKRRLGEQIVDPMYFRQP